MAHRASMSSCVLTSRRSPLHLRSSIVRSRPQHVSQFRQLWWWGRHGNEWSSSFDENLEEKSRRHERILRHRYSKMLRRRALWERDYNSRLSWPWKLSHRWLGGHISDVQNMSSTLQSRSKMEEQHDEDSSRDSPLATFHRDFQSFKKAVDRAIERDPYGTLFGRRLQSPPTNNNSSWTSFSWIFDPKEIKEDKVEQEVTESPAPPTPPKQASTTPQSSGPLPHEQSQAGTTPIPTTQSVATDEYEYDPISMRKVPKVRSEPSESSREPTQPNHEPSEPPRKDPSPKSECAEPSRKTLFETLFCENGCDIPVKTYKPHKVFGYGAEPKRDVERETRSPKQKVGFETSRKREFNALKAATLGNTIDTTAEYGGKYHTQENAASGAPGEARRDQSEPSEDAPLFSGTTYEARSTQLLKSTESRSEWLRREGFGIPATPKNVEEAFEIPVKKFKPRTEPSVDRLERSTDKSQNLHSDKLQPALDRRPDSTEASPLSKGKDGSVEPSTEKPEDLEFLRASDVRAATRSARVSKQEVQERKTEARKKLEDDFSTRLQSEAEQSYRGDWGRSKISKSLDTVWKHVRDYPDGIVARTVKSMGIFNDNFKKYVRPDKPKTDVHEKLVFKDESLSKVSSIYKPSRKSVPAISFMPSKEVQDAERLNRERTRVLQNANSLARASAEVEAANAAELARDLRREYESEYGKINVRHRQVKSGDLDQIPVSEVSNDTTKPHPLSTVTVKEGVARYPAIESHIFKFEPEFERLLQETKLVRKELHDAKNHLKELKVRMNQKPWNEINRSFNPAEVQSEQELTEETSPHGLDGPIATQPPAAPSVPGDESVLDTPPPVTAQQPVFTPDGSPIWNDEQPPSISELKRSYASPYVILEYCSETQEVTRRTANYHEAEEGASAPLKILSQLRQPQKFFPYLVALENEKYEIVSGTTNALTFRKIRDPTTVKQEAEEAKARLAAEEAAAQPVTHEDLLEFPQPFAPPTKEAATVLDEIPAVIDPPPGPAAPTAPPTTPTSRPTPVPLPRPKVRRQENVFSGTRRPAPPVIDGELPSFGASRPAIEDETTEIPLTSPFRRFLRSLNRIVLGTLAVGVGAYVVGVITEGLDAKAQQKAIQSGHEGPAEVGPRKKIVLPAQAHPQGPTRTRPGIFSTENSR